MSLWQLIFFKNYPAIHMLLYINAGNVFCAFTVYIDFHMCPSRALLRLFEIKRGNFLFKKMYLKCRSFCSGLCAARHINKDTPRYMCVCVFCLYISSMLSILFKWCLLFCTFTWYLSDDKNITVVWENTINSLFCQSEYMLRNPLLIAQQRVMINTFLGT